MNLCNFSDKNIKFTILESETVNLNEDDYYVEIIINKNFLNDILINYSVSNYYGIDFELTKRELQVLKYLSLGYNNIQIAKKLK